MRAQLPLLMVTLAGVLLPARGCILCDPSVGDGLKNLENSYLPQHLPPKDQEDVIKRLESAVQEFQELPIDDQTYMGAVDESTLHKAAWSFLSDLGHLTSSGVKGEVLVKELFWMIERQKKRFLDQSAQFLKESYCPNKCGLMLQALIWCKACEKQVHACRKSRDCGERQIEVHEMEDMILDCELNWHHASQGLTNYRFYRVWDNETEDLLTESQQPILAKPMVGPKDAGNYRCELGTVTNSPATIIYFHVKVLPKRTQEEPQLMPAPEKGVPGTLTTTLQEPTTTLQEPLNPAEMLKIELIWLLLPGLMVVACSTGALIFFFRPQKDPKS